MKLFGRQLDGFAKALLALLAVFVILGCLYGIDVTLLNHGNLPGSDGTPLVLLGIASLAATLAVAGVIVLLLVAWGVRRFYLRLRRSPH